MSEPIGPAWEGDFEFECINCKKIGARSVLSTTMAASRTRIENGIQYTGIRCPDCGKSFTVEALATDESAPPPEKE